MPTERPDAGTVKLEVTLPAEHPIRSVRTKLMAGWTVSVTKKGETVRTITWTADPGVRIGPGEYQEFDVSAGPLPKDTDQLVLPAAATTSGADPTARWIGGAGLAGGAHGLSLGAGAVLRTRRASSS